MKYKDWNLTLKELEQMGFIPDVSSSDLNRFYCKVTRGHIYIYSSTTYPDLVNYIYGNGFDNGVIEGKIAKPEK